MKSKDPQAADKRANKQRQQQQLLLVANGDPSANVSLGSLSAGNKTRKPAGQSAGIFPDLSRRHSRAPSDDTDQTDSVSKWNMSTFLRREWLLLLTMAVILGLAAVLVAILTLGLLERPDQCSEDGVPFQQPTYKLFATKTSYQAADAQLRRRPDSAPALDQLPSIFAKSEPLRELHERLTQGEANCSLRQFHFVGRHAARFPNAKRISQLNQLLANVQSRIDLSKYSLPSATNSSGSAADAHAGNRSAPANSSAAVCSNPLAQYKQWSSFMEPQQGNLITDAGAREATALAAGYKAIYPEAFDAKRAKIELGTTEELRTAQTALEFVKQLDNFTLAFCQLDQFPLDNLSDASRAAEILANPCLLEFVRKFHLDKLSCHKRCKELVQDTYPLPFNLSQRDPRRIEPIAQSASKKLRLSEDERLSVEETMALYRLCTFDSARTGASIWCSLFSDDDLKFLEFIEDVEHFFNQAYGDPRQYRSACPITADLMRALKMARPPYAPLESHFYFTHSAVIVKLLAASVDLETDPEYQPDRIVKSLNARRAPEGRQWRSSLFAPMSANLAFTLYECPRSSASGRPQAVAAAIAPNQAGGEQELPDRSFKVVASLNQMPITLDGCSSHVCDVSELVHDGRLNNEKRCKLEEICRINYQLPSEAPDNYD